LPPKNRVTLKEELSSNCDNTVSVRSVADKVTERRTMAIALKLIQKFEAIRQFFREIFLMKTKKAPDQCSGACLSCIFW
jgi:hypothetical protein